MMSRERVVDEPASSVSWEMEMEREGRGQTLVDTISWTLGGGCENINDKAMMEGVDKATCSNYWCCRY